MEFFFGLEIAVTAIFNHAIAGEVIRGLFGVTVEELIESHSVKEAAIALETSLQAAATAGADVDAASIGVPVPETVTIDEAAVAPLRLAAVSAIVTVCALKAAISNDVSKDLCLETVPEGRRSVLFVCRRDKVASTAALFGYGLRWDPADFPCQLEIVPRQSGDPAGFIAEMRKEADLKEQVAQLVAHGLADAITDTIDPYAVLSAAESIDLSPALGVATADDRHRLNALWERAENTEGFNEALSGRMGRSLLQSLEGRLFDRVANAGFGVVEQHGDFPALWSYASRSEAGVFGGLLSLLGDRTLSVRGLSCLIERLTLVLMPTDRPAAPRLTLACEGSEAAETLLKSHGHTFDVIACSRSATAHTCDLVSRRNGLLVDTDEDKDIEALLQHVEQAVEIQEEA